MADEPVKDPATATPTATVMTGSDPKPTDGAPAGDPKPGDKPVADPAKPKEGDSKKPESAPEKYEAFKLPEGLQMDEGKFANFSTLAKELNLSQANAQRLVDLAVKNGENDDKLRQEAWAKQRETWVKEIKADPEIGGQKLNETVQYAKRALKEFGNLKLMEYLDNSGLGDHPELVRVFAKIGQKMSDDKVVDGKPSGTADNRSAAEVIYGKSN